ncbi:MAG: transglutaminase family protein [Phycisphaerales bacterium]
MKWVPRSPHAVFYRSLLWAAIGSVMVYSIAEQSPAYALLSMIGILSVWFVSVAPNRPAPRLMINTVLLAVIAFAGGNMIRIGVGVSSFANFAALLMIVKMLDLRTARDDGQILVLSVAILIAAALTSNSLLTGIFTILEMILILRAVIFYQIHTVLSKSNAEWQPIIKSMRVDIRSIMIAGSFLCALLGAIVFIVMPRNVGVQAFGQWGGSRSVSGFADSIELGRPGFISTSSEPVMDITVTDRNGLNIGRENAPAAYFRGAVLNEYVDGRWESIPNQRDGNYLRSRLIEPYHVLKSSTEGILGTWDVQYEVTLRSAEPGESYLFAPWRPVEFRVGNEPTRLRWDFNTGIFMRDGLGGQFNYVVRTEDMEFADTTKHVSSEHVKLRREVDTSIIPDRVAQLSNRVLIDAGIEPDPAKRTISDDINAARVFENYLRTQFAYTLEVLPVPRGIDATEWFLFDRKQGHCEFFASALTMMSRSVGIPARVVTGYIVSDYNTVTGQYVVRQSNAHAWVEAQVSPGIWRTFDGTPPEEFHALHEPDPSLWRSVAKVYESMESFWVKTVVGFNSKSREHLIGSQSTDFGIGARGDTILQRLAAGRWKLLARSATVSLIVFSISMLIGVILLKSKSIARTMLSECSRLLHLSWFNSAPKLSEHQARQAKIKSLIDQKLDGLGIPKPGWLPMKQHLAEQKSSIAILPDHTQQAITEATAFLYTQFSPNSPSLDPDGFTQFVHDLERKLRASENTLADQTRR